MINIWDQLHAVCIFGDFKDQRLLVVSNNDNQYYSNTELCQVIMSILFVIDV